MATKTKKTAIRSEAAGPLAATTDGHPAAVAAVPLETGLTLPSLVVPVGFGEVRVSVGPAGEATAAVA